MQAKVDASLQVIREAIEKHGHKLFTAYSGGKDSQALVQLVRQVHPSPLILHNRFDGEVVREEFGMLVLRQPKVPSMNAFLSLAEIEAQLDGTRRSEDKKVMFDGHHIHRSRMRGPHTSRGYYDLAVYFPIWDWTDAEVLEFLRR